MEWDDDVIHNQDVIVTHEMVQFLESRGTIFCRFVYLLALFVLYFCIFYFIFYKIIFFNNILFYILIICRFSIFFKISNFC